MGTLDGWETIDQPLGTGGQGIVYKARSPEQVRRRDAALRHILLVLSNPQNLDTARIESIAKLIIECGKPDAPGEIGALKQFNIPTNDPQKAAKAQRRLEAEIDTLRLLTKQNCPGILRLLHGNAEAQFMVTEYHPKGTLDGHLGTFKGNPIKALKALRPLVAALAEVHRNGKIHRDIKTQNVFIANDRRLVLGDFGIVFYQDAHHTRLTDLQGERVGSHFWMPPWAYEATQLPIDEIKPSLDIYPLAKILWSMIAGRDGPAFWEYERPGNDLRTMFPDDPAMTCVNQILAKCLVREEKDCLQSAEKLGALIDETMEEIRRLGQKPEQEGGRWLCLVCKKGYYGKESWYWSLQLATKPQNFTLDYPIDVQVWFCDHCGHMRVFRQ